VALRTVAKDGHFFVFDDVHIAIAIVINAHLGAPLWVDGGRIGNFRVICVHCLTKFAV
jgi:hypothetical protein